MDKWYTRPVLFVADLGRAVDFYTALLGFRKVWGYGQEDGETVCQVNRGGCEIILATDPERAGRSRLFISLETDELQRLREELSARPIPAERSWWGYPVLTIKDPDGNELMVLFEESEGDE